MGFIQTETPYFQPSPKATVPFPAWSARHDPNFSVFCAGKSDNCNLAWGLRVLNSQNILVYGAGLYSFFNNYSLSAYFLASSLPQSHLPTINNHCTNEHKQPAPTIPPQSIMSTAKTRFSALTRAAELARPILAARFSCMASTLSAQCRWLIGMERVRPRKGLTRGTLRPRLFAL